MKPAISVQEQKEKMAELAKQASQTKTAKLEIGLNDTAEGVELQQGAVELDVNMVQETVEIQVQDKTWFRISFAAISNAVQGITACCFQMCVYKKKETPATVVDAPPSVLEAEPVVS